MSEIEPRAGVAPERPPPELGGVRIVPPEARYLEAMYAVWDLAFNPSPESRAARRPERVRLDRYLVAMRDDRVLATAMGLPMLQWFGGRPLRTVGVAAVATDPLHRGLGLASSVVAELLRRHRDLGRDLATLYPATVPVYRRLGFEYAGVQTRYRMHISALPAPGDDAPEVADAGQDVEPLLASYHRLAERENGLTEGVEDDWWTVRILGRENPAGPATAVATPGPDPDGYAVFRQEAVQGGDGWGFDLVCSHLVASTPAAARALFGYFRRFRGLGQDLTWHGPPTEPLAMLLPEQSLETASTFRNMSRILDVKTALEGRGYPTDVSGAATISVIDPVLPENTGAFDIEADGGKVRVTRLDAGPGGRPSLGIGALTTMFAGYLTPAQAVRGGLVDPTHPALDLLGRLFAGPPAWTPDFF
jgi:predicted acetyltransferase